MSIGASGQVPVTSMPFIEEPLQVHCINYLEISQNVDLHFNRLYELVLREPCAVSMLYRVAMCYYQCVCAGVSILNFMLVSNQG